MKEVQINRNLILREDGKLFNVKTGEEYVPPTRNNYYAVSIKHVTKNVHQLVMEYFGPPKPSSKHQIDHINRNPLDNRLENLRWVTPIENLYNKNNNQPIGERVCDYENIAEYAREKYNKNKERMREYYREYKRKWRAKKKKEGL